MRRCSGTHLAIPDSPVPPAIVYPFVAPVAWIIEPSVRIGVRLWTVLRRLVILQRHNVTFGVPDRSVVVRHVNQLEHVEDLSSQRLPNQTLILLVTHVRVDVIAGSRPYAVTSSRNVGYRPVIHFGHIGPAEGSCTEATAGVCISRWSVSEPFGMTAYLL